MKRADIGASVLVGRASSTRPPTAGIWIVGAFTLVAASVCGWGSSAPATTTPPVSTTPPDTQLIVSPDGHLQAAITIAEDVRYALTLDGTQFVLPSPVSLSLADGRVLGRGARIVRVDRREISEEIPTPIDKRAKVKNACRELAILLSDGATLRARVFDDGFALRWETALPGRIRVREEGFSIAFRDDPTMFFLGGDGAHHGYEGLWRHEPISTLASSTQTAQHRLAVVGPARSHVAQSRDRALRAREERWRVRLVPDPHPRAATHACTGPVPGVTTSSIRRAYRPATTSRFPSRACSQGRWTTRQAPCARSRRRTGSP